MTHLFTKFWCLGNQAFSIHPLTILYITLRISNKEVISNILQKDYQTRNMRFKISNKLLMKFFKSTWIKDKSGFP